MKCFTQGRNRLVFLAAVAFGAGSFFILDIDELACLGIRCVMAGAATLVFQGVGMGLMVEIDGRAAQFAEDLGMSETVGILLGLDEGRK